MAAMRADLAEAGRLVIGRRAPRKAEIPAIKRYLQPPHGRRGGQRFANVTSG